ncbi:hypothetical protein D049_0324A, partial [Vibrio parahaemolyticus VPTS-2010]
MVAAV